MLPAVGSLRLHILHTQRRRWVAVVGSAGAISRAVMYFHEDTIDSATPCSGATARLKTGSWSSGSTRVGGGLGALLGAGREVN